MTNERKGEIALLLVEHHAKEKGIKLTPESKRELGNAAKKIGVQPDELKEFFELIVKKLTAEFFAAEQK